MERRAGDFGDYVGSAMTVRALSSCSHGACRYIPLDINGVCASADKLVESR